MAKDSSVNPKMLAILTDKEIEELKERAIRQRNFYAANLLWWEADVGYPLPLLIKSLIAQFKLAARFGIAHQLSLIGQTVEPAGNGRH